MSLWLRMRITVSVCAREAAGFSNPATRKNLVCVCVDSDSMLYSEKKIKRMQTAAVLRFPVWPEVGVQAAPRPRPS